MPVSANFIRMLEGLQPELREVFLAFWEEIERQRTVTREEFNELKEIVRDISENLKGLAQAQRRTEERLNELSERVNQLAEAQRKTEERLNQLAVRVDQLAEAQRKTEERLNELEKRMEEGFARVWEAIERLTEAQRRTEERLNQLAEAQRKTEERLNELTERVNQLTEAQRRTEKEIEKLTKGLESLRKEVGGLAHTVEYQLEDEAIKALPELLKRDAGVEVVGRLKRDYIEIAPGKYIEVNIWGTGRINGEEYVIVGEARSQLKKGDVDEFIKKVNAIKRYIPKEQIKILVTYQTSPIVRKYAEEKGIKIYFSYEF
jgi:chromosome segregation ATPase